MAKLERKPFPPGSYPVVVVGSGPGGLQISYCLRSLGIDHAVVSQDEAAGGMFRKFPLYDRLITWTKPYAPVERGTREYEWHDWNSLLVEDPRHYVCVAQFMDGVSEFPTRDQMQHSLEAFARKARVRIRYACRWEGTSMRESDFVIHTSDGDYRCKVAIFAVGMTEPWKPDDIPGIDEARHYMLINPNKKAYAGKRIYIMGKRASAFEIADGLLPWASQLILSSPSPPSLSVVAHSTAAVRARYMQPLEDHAFGNKSVVILNASTERIKKTSGGFRIHLKSSDPPRSFVFDVDEAIIATGVSTPMRDLPDLGVQTFYRGSRLPRQTPFWESASLPGIYFAGSITQGSFGLRKYSGSPAVHGFRYNARILAGHIGEKHFGVKIKRRKIAAARVAGFLLAEVTRGPELWNQQSYLGRVVSFDPGRGILDEGVQPLSSFVDAHGPDAVAVGVEFGSEGEAHPTLYARRSGNVEEHSLPPDPLFNFEGPEHRAALSSILKGLVE